MKIRITKVYEKELTEFLQPLDDSLETIRWLDHSYYLAEDNKETYDRYYTEGGEEPPTFPVTDPQDGLKVDKCDHVHEGMDLDELGFEEKEVKWEVVDDIGLPVKQGSKSPMNVTEAFDQAQKVITSSERTDYTGDFSQGFPV